MKGKIIAFFIGLFIGAIISTASIYCYTLANNNSTSSDNTNTQQTMPSGGPGENGGQGGQQGTPPSMPNGTQTNTQAATA